MNKTIKLAQKLTIYFILIAVPVAVLPIASNPFVVSKMAVLLFAMGVLFLLHAAEIVSTGKLKFAVSAYDLPVALFALAYALAAVFQTPNIMDAILLPGTATAVVTSAVLYFLINQQSGAEKENIKVALTAGAGLFSLLMLLGYAKVFELIPQLPAFMRAQTFTPEGGYLPAAIFLVVIIPMAIGSFLTASDIKKRTITALSLAVISLGALLAIYQMLPGKITSPQLNSFSASWQTAVEVLKREPILGVGPGNYLTAYNRYRPLEVNTSDLWSVRFASARSFILTSLTETGLLGVAALLMIMVFVYRSTKVLVKEGPGKRDNYAAYTSAVSLVVMAVSLILFPATFLLIMLFFVALSLNATTKLTRLPLLAKDKSETAVTKFPAILVATPLVILVAFVYYYSGRILVAEYRFTRALGHLSRNEAQQTVDTLVSAINQNPRVDRYRATYSRVNIALADAIARNEEITDEDRNSIAQLVQLSISEAKAAVALNPTRAGNWEVLGRTYQAIIPVAQGADLFAAQSYQQAVALDPYNPSLRIVLGGLFYQAGNYEQAIRIFELATQIKPDLANAHYNLAFALREAGQTERAIQELTTVLSLVPRDSQDYELAQQALSEMQAASNNQLPEESGGDLTPPPGEEEQLLDPPLDLPEDANPPEAPEDEEAEDPLSSPSPSPAGSPQASPSPTPAL